MPSTSSNDQSYTMQRKQQELNWSNLIGNTEIACINYCKPFKYLAEIEIVLQSVKQASSQFISTVNHLAILKLFCFFYVWVQWSLHFQYFRRIISFLPSFCVLEQKMFYLCRWPASRPVWPSAQLIIHFTIKRSSNLIHHWH